MKNYKQILAKRSTLEKIERDVTEEFIETIKKLQELGVDTNKLQFKDTIKMLSEK